MALADEDLAQIKDLINATVNGAAATQKKLVEGALKKSGEDFAKMVEEKLSALKPPEGGEGGKGGKNKGQHDDPETQQLRKSVEELRRSVDEANAVASRERARNVENASRQAVFDALGELGLDQHRAKGAFASFKLDDRIETQIDEDAGTVTVLFREDDGTPAPLRDGLKRWSKTESAKLYLPPTGARGAGSRPGTMRGPDGKALPRDQVEANAMNYLAKALRNEGVVGFVPGDE